MKVCFGKGENSDSSGLQWTPILMTNFLIEGLWIAGWMIAARKAPFGPSQWGKYTRDIHIIKGSGCLLGLAGWCQLI